MLLASTVTGCCPLQGQTTDPMEVISLRNPNGMQADILPVGATIQRLLVPDKNGIAEDIVLGYDSPKHYQVLLLIPVPASQPVPWLAIH